MATANKPRQTVHASTLPRPANDGGVLRPTLRNFNATHNVPRQQVDSLQQLMNKKSTQELRCSKAMGKRIFIEKSTQSTTLHCPSQLSYLPRRYDKHTPIEPAEVREAFRRKRFSRPGQMVTTRSFDPSCTTSTSLQSLRGLSMRS